MKKHLVPAAFLMMAGLAHGQFRELWHLGENDGNANDFVQELGGGAAEPGSATARDDDYYFAGIYPDPIGTLREDETTTDVLAINNTSPKPTGFERAVTSGSTNSRIHFNLTESEANTDADYRFTLDLFGGGTNVGGYGTHDLEIFFNETSIHKAVGISEDREIVEVVASGAVMAVEGPNKVEIIRTGGSDGSWIQFDNIILEIDESRIECLEPVCNFVSSANVVTAGSGVTLHWLTSSEASVTIDNGIGAVTAGVFSLEVFPTKSTTYIMTSVFDGVTGTAGVTVFVDLISSFNATQLEVSPGSPTSGLQWSVDPADGVTVSIDQGVGDVTGLTVGGIGSVEVSPVSDTIYTMTVTRPNSPADDVETATVTLDFEFDDYSTLWTLGMKDGLQSEFNQEIGGSNPAPGSATLRDDDYYFAGNYSLIGIVAQDEIVTDPVQQNATSVNPVGMERAITSGDPNTRIHFILSESDAAPGKEFRFETVLQSGGWSGGGFGIHDVEIFFNDVSIFNQTGITFTTPVRENFATESVNAVPGENIVEVVRTGGASDPANPGGSTGWIQFDFFSLEVRGEASSPLGFRITDFAHDPGTGMTSLTFPSQLGQTFKIETSPDLENWSPLEVSLPADSAGMETTYSFSQSAPKSFLQVTRN